MIKDKQKYQRPRLKAERMPQVADNEPRKLAAGRWRESPPMDWSSLGLTAEELSRESQPQENKK